MTADTAHHLDSTLRINLGAYYTKETFVDLVWQLIRPHLRPQTVILDSSCGFGNFFRPNKSYRQIGNDIDKEAIENIKDLAIECHNRNALYQVSRSQYKISNRAHLCIIGNPPYNDTTSLIRRQIKNDKPLIDQDLATRDLGLSFLLSYQKLNADLVCVLHPLSYLIKPSNFRRLKRFTSSYQLIEAKVISSAVFSQASRAIHFPIVIALYLKSRRGMNYQDMLNFRFWVEGGHAFTLADFDTITEYVHKYPNHRWKPKADDLLFWTLRDLNALKRNQTFVTKPSTNTIIIDKSQLDYYVYIDVIKEFSHRFPYYFGNCDVLIDDQGFKQHRQHFIIEALSRHPALRRYYPDFDLSVRAVSLARNRIQLYLQELLGDHYVD